MGFRSTKDYSCEANYWVEGYSHEIVGPNNEVLQQFPTVLAGWARASASTWQRCQIHKDNPKEGTFKFRVGTGFVPVEYRIEWLSERVDQLELVLGINRLVAEMAGEEMQKRMPRDLDDLLSELS